MLYFFLFILLFLCGVFDIYKVSFKLRTLVYFSLITIIFFLGSLRWETGTDWIAYHDFFVSYNDFNSFLSKGFEIGFATLNFLVKSVTNSYTIFLAVFMFLILRYKSLLFRHQYFREYSLITLLLFYCYYLGDIFFVRQAFAISLCFYAIIFIYKKSFIRFVITIIIAGLFHSTAFLFIIAYPIGLIELKTKWIILLLVISLIIGLALTYSGNVSWLNNIPLISNISRFQEKLEVYSELTQMGEKGFGQKTDPLVSFIVGFIRKALVLIPIIIYRKKLQSKFSFFNVLFNLIVFGAIFYFILGSISQVFKRGATYFDGAELVCLPLFLYLIKSKRERFVLYIVIGIYAFSKLYFIVNAFWDLYVPYYSIFDSFIPRDLY